MSGHSKWKNIMHKRRRPTRSAAYLHKNRQGDIPCRKAGGPTRPQLQAARPYRQGQGHQQRPQRQHRKAHQKSGGADTADYEEIRYEGYGPSGVAILVDTLTDNRNRTRRSAPLLDKYGGNLGQSGSVAWQFETKGIVAVEAAGVEEEALMECALEAGAEDFSREDEVYEITCAPAALEQLREALEGTGYTLLSAQAEEVPSTYVSLSGEEDVKNMQRLLELLKSTTTCRRYGNNWDSDVR